MFTQRNDESLWKYGDAVFVALATEHPHLAARQIDVMNPQAQQLQQAQATPIHEFSHKAGRAFQLCKHLLAFFRGQHRGDALTRSGSNAKKLQVELALKIAIPFICLLIALLGAPLAISSPKSGAAWGVAASLATTFIVLLMFQLAKAVGAGGVLPPALAAWTPNILVGVAAVYLLRKAPT